MKQESKKVKKLKKTINDQVKMDLESHNQPYPNSKYEPKQYVKEKVKHNI